MIYAEDVLERLVKTRKELGLSQRFVAVRADLGVSRSGFAKMEIGLTPMPVSVLCVLINFYKVSPYYILTGTTINDYYADRLNA